LRAQFFKFCDKFAAQAVQFADRQQNFAGEKIFQIAEFERRAAEPAKLLTSLRSAAVVCATMVDALPADQRGFHPMGNADASGFAAMACDEILIHTRDAGTGLGAEFTAETGLAGRVLARLFPWYEPVPDPWTALLHANGRIDLPGRQHQPERWQWHCAPLAEWDGTVPPAFG